MNDRQETMDRRGYLTVLGAAGIAGLAGCSGDDSNSQTGNGEENGVTENGGENSGENGAPGNASQNGGNNEVEQNVTPFISFGDNFSEETGSYVIPGEGNYTVEIGNVDGATVNLVDGDTLLEQFGTDVTDPDIGNENVSAEIEFAYSSLLDNPGSGEYSLELKTGEETVSKPVVIGEPDPFIGFEGEKVGQNDTLEILEKGEYTIAIGNLEDAELYLSRDGEKVATLDESVSDPVKGDSGKTGEYNTTFENLLHQAGPGDYTLNIESSDKSLRTPLVIGEPPINLENTDINIENLPDNPELLSKINLTASVEGEEPNNIYWVNNGEQIQGRELPYEINELETSNPQAVAEFPNTDKTITKKANIDPVPPDNTDMRKKHMSLHPASRIAETPYSCTVTDERLVRWLLNEENYQFRSGTFEVLDPVSEVIDVDEFDTWSEGDIHNIYELNNYDSVLNRIEDYLERKPEAEFGDVRVYDGELTPPRDDVNSIDDSISTRVHILPDDEMLMMADLGGWDRDRLTDDLEGVIDNELVSLKYSAQDYLESDLWQKRGIIQDRINDEHSYGGAQPYDDLPGSGYATRPEFPYRVMPVYIDDDGDVIHHVRGFNQPEGNDFEDIIMEGSQENFRGWAHI